MNSRPPATRSTATCTASACSSAFPMGSPPTPSAGTGTVFRRPILTDYATRAGFSDVSVLPITDFSFFRFYRLHS